MNVLYYSILLHSQAESHHSVSYLISATWWTHSSIYIPEYSQYWYQHAVMNLVTTRRECTLLQYSTTLSSGIISLYIIFDICNMMKLPFYIYSSILPVLISTCCIEFNHLKREFSVLQYSTALSSVITSFCIIFDICYMMNLAFYIYSRILPVLISTCFIEFNHYKTWIYSIKVFYNTLKLNHIILYHIWYLQYIQLPFYIYSRILPVWFQHAVLNLITTRREFTLLQYSKTLSSIIASFCITFDNCYMMIQQYIYILVYSQYWYQHAVMNLVTTRREFTLLEYSTILSSLITSFSIIFDICNIMQLPFYIYSSILQVLFQHAALNLVTTRREFTLFQYSKTLSSIITSFCIIFNICYMMNQQYYIYSSILQVLFQHAALNLITTRREFTITVFYNTVKLNHIILCDI